MARSSKGSIGWDLVAGQWMPRAAAFILSLSLVEAVYAQSSTTITNPTLVSGNVVWTQLPDGNWVFTIGSQSAIVNFTSFGIAAGQEVQFIMNPDMRILNRVLGDFPTHINGRLLASGQVFIVNPAGVFIGPTGLVNVGRLYAAAGDIKDADFESSNYTFTMDVASSSAERHTVRNEGRIEASEGVFLVGKQVVNGPTGNILVGPGGVAVMVGHNGDVTLFEPGSNVQLFAVSNSLGNAGAGFEPGVTNSGNIETASGGSIQLGAGDVYSVAIRNSGQLRAEGGEVRMVGRDIEQSGGQLTAASFFASNGATAANQLTISGTVNADQVVINANTLALSGATIFRGDGGAGDLATSVSVTGNIRSDGVATRELTFQSNTTTVVGDMGGAGANQRLESLNASGDLSTTGQVRVVGNANIVGALTLNGTVAQSVTAATIDLGSLSSLEDATITGTSVGINGNAASNKNLTIIATEAVTGSVVVAGNATAGAGSDLVITSAGDASVNGVASAGRDVQVVAVGNAVVDSLTAGGSATVSGANATVNGNAAANGGTLFVNATAGNALVGGDATASNDVTITAAGGSSFAGSVTAGGDATVSGNNATVAGNAAANGGALVVNATGGNAAVGGDATATGDVTITAIGGDASAASVTAGGNATVQGANVTVTNNAAANGGVLVVNATGGNATVGGAATADTDVTITATGDASAGSVTAGGNAFVSGANATVTNNAAANGGLLLVNATGGNAAVGGDATATGDVAITATGDASAGSVTAGGNATVQGANAAVTNNAAANGGALLVNATGGNATVGGAATASGDVQVLASGDASAGSVTAGGNAFVLGANATVTNNAAANGGVLFVNATGGNASVGGDATASGDLTITATGDASAGSVTAGGNARVQGANAAVTNNAAANGGVLLVIATGGNASVGGDAAASGNVQVSATGDATAGSVTAGGNAVVVGSNAAVTNNAAANGGELLVNATGGNATVGGAATADTDVTITATGDASAGSVTAGGNAFVSGANATVTNNAAANGGELLVNATGGNASVGGDATATSDVTITATGDASAGSVTAGGNATVQGANATVTNNAAANGGALLVNATGGNASVGGAATASGDVTITATGDASAGSVLAGNNATVQGVNAAVNGNAEATAGTLLVSATGGNASVTGNAIAGLGATINAVGGNASVGGNADANGGALLVNATGGNASVTGSAEASTDVTITATGNASAGSVLAGNNATVTGATATVNGNAEATTGALVVTGVAGQARILGNARAGTDLTVTAAAGGIELGGNVDAVNNVLLDANGQPVTFSGAAAQTVTADTGSLEIRGSVAKAAGNLTLDGGTTIDIDGAVNVGGSFSSVSTGATTFDSSVTAGDDLSIAAGSINLFSNLAGGSDVGDELSLTGPIVLRGDSRWSAERIRVNGFINAFAAGGQSLRIASEDRALFDGDIGNLTRLNQVVLESGFTVFGSAPGAAFTINANLFNLDVDPAARAAGNGVDFASPRAVIMNVDNFTMRQGTKASILGAFTINSPTGTVRLSDVNTVGLFRVDAASIVIVSRDVETPLISTGVGPRDRGVDFVSLGGFDFSVVPTIDGTGSVTFGSPNATGDISAASTLRTFVMLNINDSFFGVSGLGYSNADFANGVFDPFARSFFDLIADGSTKESSATAIAANSPQQAPNARETGGVALSAGERRQLQELLPTIEIRLPSGSELLDISAGSVAFSDFGRKETAQVAGEFQTDAITARSGDFRRPLPAVVQRFSGARVRDLLRTVETLNSTPSSLIASAAGKLEKAHASGKSLTTALEGVSSADERNAMLAIARFVQFGEQLGLSETERMRAGSSTTPWPQSFVAGNGGLERFSVPASAFTGEFWMAANSPVASR